MPANTNSEKTAKGGESYKSLDQKLFELQKKIKTFAVTEESEKKSQKGKSEYRYTPSWVIIEKLREMMDEMGLMLIPVIKGMSSRPVETISYKMINGQPMSFVVKEIQYDIDMEFTWKDITTSEESETYPWKSSGTNGTDKGLASAITLGERYFLKSFLHFTTHETEDEPDAHDSGTIPGLPPDRQPAAAPPAQAAQAQPVQQAFMPVQQQPAAARNPYPNPPAYGTPAPVQGAQFNPSDPLIQQVINKLAVNDKGTPGHQRTINESIGSLSAAGYNCFAPHFLDNIIECGQAIREGRTPNIQ